MRKRIFGAVALGAEYCKLLENCKYQERDELLDKLLNLLPSLYIAFTDIKIAETEPEEEEYFESYIDEDYYESVRRSLETIWGAEDTFLETFEEDMKFSDTPIAASISESLADIFQPLYNFVLIVRDSDGEKAVGAFRECKENFQSYWSQTLCNVLRALNHIKYS